MNNKSIVKPIVRSKIRAKAGFIYYGTKRKFSWIKMCKYFAKEKSNNILPFLCFEHKTPLMRKLKDVDMYLQENKVVNLKIATPHINKIVIHPGEIFSYWYLIGSTTKRKGYKDGMILKNGGFSAGTGGGLCQLSNMIFWMAVHTPLTIIERHRHGYDVFPDSNRTQPFGSGATCFYPHGDLMIRNDTQNDYQIIVQVGEEYLHGEIRCSTQPMYRYEIVERNHEMKTEFWGGYSRHNELYQQTFNLEGELVDEKMIVENSAIMMYSPFLESSGQS